MTYIKSLVKAIKYPLVIAIGMLIASFIGNYPLYANMTLGAFLIFLYDVVKHRLNVKLP